MKKFLFILLLGFGAVGFMTACEDKADDSASSTEEPADAATQSADSGDTPDAEDSGAPDTGGADTSSED